MNLYCYKLEYNGEIDVYHMVAENNGIVHMRLDATVKALEKQGYKHMGYSFFKVDKVDGFSIGELLENKLNNK